MLAQLESTSFYNSYKRPTHPKQMLKSPIQAPLSWLAIMVALLATIGFIVWQLSGDNAHPHDHDHAAADPHKHDHESEKLASGSKTKPTSKHSHSVSRALQLEGPEYVDIRRGWFEPPRLESTQRFSPSSTPLSVDPSCTRRNEMQHASLETSIRKTVGVDTAQSIPLDALTQQVSQFWQRDSWFYQFSATWDKDIPATYTLEHYRTKQADFQGEVERLNVVDAGPMDAISMATRIEDALADAESRGAKRGARLVHLLLGGDEGDALQDLKIANGRPVAWMFGNGHCRLRNDGAAFCRCIDPTNATKEQKGEHSVID